MKYLTLTFFMISCLCTGVNAEDLFTSPSECGQYKVHGVVRMREGKIKVIVHEKTRSEIELSFDLLEQPRLTPFFERPIDLTVVLDKKWNGTRAEVSSITKTPSDRVPDPLNPRDTGFLLLKTLPCLK